MLITREIFADNDTLKKLRTQIKSFLDIVMLMEKLIIVQLNGSIKNIAGIINENGNVLDDADPERATCNITKLYDGENLFKSLVESLF